MPNVDWQELRQLFPVLRQWTYLNTASFGPVPTSAVAAMTRHFDHRNEVASTDFLNWYDRLDEIRAKIGLLIGAGADDIAFCPNTATGLSWLINGISWKSGDQILILENEFPNNLYAPTQLATQGVTVRTVPVDAASFDPQSVVDAVSDRTRLAILSAVNYSSGLRLPLDFLAPALKQRGVITCVDGTQSVGALHHDLAEVPVDYLMVHAYKWMCSPTGAGFVYASPETREWLAPSIVSWRSHKDWRNVDHLHHGPPDLPSEAARYEGGIQNFSGILAMEAVLNLMLDIRTQAIEDRVLALAERCRQTVLRHGGLDDESRPNWSRSQIAAVPVPGQNVSDLAAKLKKQSILLAARKGRLRVAPHFFNNSSDVDALDHALAR